MSLHSSAEYSGAGHNMVLGIQDSGIFLFLITETCLGSDWEQYRAIWVGSWDVLCLWLPLLTFWQVFLIWPSNSFRMRSFIGRRPSLALMFAALSAIRLVARLSKLGWLEFENNWNTQWPVEHLFVVFWWILLADAEIQNIGYIGTVGIVLPVGCGDPAL